MRIPREKSPIINAPVLFRLPNLQNASCPRSVTTAEALSKPEAATDHLPEKSSPGKNQWASESRPVVESPGSTVPTHPSQQQPQSEPIGLASDDSFMDRWGVEIKRSVILLAAFTLLWGAWMMGQKSQSTPQESNLVQSNLAETESPQGDHKRGPLATKGEDAATDGATELAPNGAAVGSRVAQIVEPMSNATGDSSGHFEPVVEPGPAIDWAAATPSPLEDRPVGDKVVGDKVVGDKDIESHFSQFSFDALEPPAQDKFYDDYELTTADVATSQKPPVTPQVSGQDSLVLNQPSEVVENAPAASVATNFVPSATPEMPGFDPNGIPDPAPAPAGNRPVLSSTPNAITDWSRYLPGAANAAVRAVSATQVMNQAGDETSGSEKQAVFFDENGRDSADVGVAPFYR